MKKVSLLSIVALFAIIACSFKGEEYKTLEIGQKAPMTDYQMEGTDGESYSLESLSAENGLLVIFSCNTCPFVIKWEGRYPGIAEMAQENEIGFSLINSNEAKRSGDDSMEEMKAHAEEKGYADVPYLVDENSKLANAFGGKTTPHVFLFNADMQLVYEGAIDDNLDDATEVKSPYLENAIKNMVAGEKIDPENTKAIGCSIKRVKS
jgi:peroxiredoxin